MSLVEILKNEGYEVVEGIDATEKMIKEKANSSNKKLCSGYGVFPNGEKCNGCDDCKAV